MGQQLQFDVAARVPPTHVQIGEFRLRGEVLDANDQVHEIGHFTWPIVIRDNATDRHHMALQRGEAADGISLRVDSGCGKLAAKILGGPLQHRQDAAFELSPGVKRLIVSALREITRTASSWEPVPLAHRELPSLFMGEP